LIRAFFGEATAKLANHGRPVLPPFVRLSTHYGVCVYGRKKGTTPMPGFACDCPRIAARAMRSALRTDARGKKRFSPNTAPLKRTLVGFHGAIRIYTGNKFETI
jgi:hypothetical protein